MVADAELVADTDRSSSSWRPAALIGALSAVLGIVSLGQKSLWYDEAFDARRVDGSWRAMAHPIMHTEMSQAAHLVVLKPWAALTSHSELTWVARERDPGDAVVVGPPWAKDAFRHYDQTTPLGIASRPGRVFFIVRAKAGDDITQIRRDSLGTIRARLINAMQFGRRLQVLVLEPLS